MYNLESKIVHEKKGCSTQEVRKYLKERFKIDVSEEHLLEIIGELVARNIVLEDRKGWIKNRID